MQSIIASIATPLLSDKTLFSKAVQATSAFRPKFDQTDDKARPMFSHDDDLIQTFF